MFYVSQNQDPRVADKDKVSLQFYLISSKTLTTGQLAGLARTLPCSLAPVLDLM